ncbi:MAG: SCO family protein [Acidobacteria bacterium]|nr:MAG: SCO family protein [Acidobacteriota bacterium]
MIIALFVIVILAVSAPGYAQDLSASTQPYPLTSVGIDQKLNSQVPLDLRFRDESGKQVRLGDFFGKKPVVLSLVYYECPMLCTLVLNGMLTSFKVLSFDIGKEFEVVTVSFNPRETAQLAAAKKESYLRRYDRPSAERGWHFLTGDEDQIAKLADAVGFRYAYDPKTEQYAHASAIMVLTPKGHVARYHYGIEYAPRDLRLSLVEASANKIGSPVDQVLLYCFHYDPLTGKYGLVIRNVLRLSGIATLVVLGGFIFLMLRRERAAKRAGVELKTKSA